MGKIHIIGGGTFSHIRAHLALSMPAFGETAIRVSEIVGRSLGVDSGYEVVLHLTRMADPRKSRLETNADVGELLDKLIADPSTRAIVFNAALTDFSGVVGEGIPSGKRAPRMVSSIVGQVIKLTAEEKLINRIRASRSDIFVVGFKTTTDKDPADQYSLGMRLLVQNGLNLVIANDLTTRNNLLISSDGIEHVSSIDREMVLEKMVSMMLSAVIS